MLVFRESDVIVGYALIDCKSYAGAVPGKQVEKLEDDINKSEEMFGSPPRWAAIMSMESDIVHDGCSGAADFVYRSTPVFLLHSCSSRGDNGSLSIRDLLGRAKFLNTLHPQIAIPLSNSTKLADFEKRLSEGRKQGRGRTHSQARSRVTFSESSRTQPAIIPRKKSRIIEDVASDIATVEDAVKDFVEHAVTPVIHTSLDPRIFVPEIEMTPANLKIAQVMSQCYEFRTDSKIKGKVVTDNLANLSRLTAKTISKCLTSILISDVRNGHWLMNLARNNNGNYEKRMRMPGTFYSVKFYHGIRSKDCHQLTTW